MCRLLLLLAILSGLVIGPCAIADGLTAVGGGTCCVPADADADADTGGGPCCPVEPEPLCQCDDADALALPVGVSVLPVSASAQEPLMQVVAVATWRCRRHVPVAARAPPGLLALRSVVLLI